MAVAAVASKRPHALLGACGTLALLLLLLAASLPRPAAAQLDGSNGTDAAAAPAAPAAESGIILPTGRLPVVPAGSAVNPQLAGQVGSTGPPPDTDSSSGGNGPAMSAGLNANQDTTAIKTAQAVEKEQQQQQAANETAGALPGGPQDSSSDDSLPSITDLVSLPGCSGPPGISFLPAGLDNECVTDSVLGRRQTAAFSFQLPPATNQTRPYRVVVLLRTIDGSAQLGISVPGASRQGGLVPNIVGSVIYNTEVTSEQFLEVPWSVIEQLRGDRYVITISRATSRLVWELKVSTPFADVRLAPADLGSMRDLADACCGDVSTVSTFCTRILPAALAPGHDTQEDLCQIPPLMCNAEGRLTQLAIAQVGMTCPNGLPSSLLGLEALNTLDLAFNNLNSTMDTVAQVMSTLPALENVFMRYTNLRGRLNCSVLSAAVNLQRLSFSGNTRLVGEVPGCLLESPTLQELYLSQTGLSGRLPDVVPRNSSLKALFAIGLFDNQRPDSTNDGITGPIPRSLLASQALQYLDISNNQLSGALPTLPANLRLLNVSGNALDGVMPATLPPFVEVLDVSFNKLTGSLPSDMSGYEALTLLDVSANQLEGSMPTALPPNLFVLDVSLNNITGPIPSPLPRSMVYLGATEAALTGALPEVPANSSLRQVLLGSNNLEGAIPLSMINGSAASLRFLDLSNNKLSGPIDTLAAQQAAAPTGGRRLLTQGPARRLQQVPAGQSSSNTSQAQDARLRQQQQQQGAEQSAAPPPTGPWASQQELSYLDLSYNQITGQVPPGLAQIPSLLYMRLDNNQLSGSLEPFADALAQANGTSSLLILDLSSNQLTGAIPAGLAAAPLLDPSTAAVGRGGRPAPRVLNLANNSFSGPFPSFLIEQPPLVEEACNGCMVMVQVNGTNNKLQCPDRLELTPGQTAFLRNGMRWQRSSLVCTNSTGQQLSLLAAAGVPLTAASPQTESGPAYTARTNPAGPVPDAQDWNSSPGSVYVPAEQQAAPSGGTVSAAAGSSSSNLNGGQIAGIVIGAIAGAVLIAALLPAVVKRHRRNRAGWRKDDLKDHNLPTTGRGGAGHLDAAFGLSPMPSAASGGAASEAGMGHNGAPLQYPHSPYNLRPAAASAIEMQHSAGKNDLSPQAHALSGVTI